MIALDDGIEALEAVAHGYRAGGFVAGIAGPSAEAGDGPAGPGEGPGRMGVLLFQRAALQFLLQNVQDLDLSFVEDAARRRHRGDGFIGAGRRIAIGGGAGQHELLMVAPIRPITASFSSAAPSSITLCSIRRPYRLRVRNNCSMCQRRRYQPITATAWATLSTRCVVKRRHSTGSSPAGASSSRTSMANSSISAGAAASEQWSGRRMRTGANRTAITAFRALRFPGRAASSNS